MRTRTQAKQRSDENPPPMPDMQPGHYGQLGAGQRPAGRGDGNLIIGNIRKSSLGPAPQQGMGRGQTQSPPFPTSSSVAGKMQGHASPSTSPQLRPQQVQGQGRPPKQQNFPGQNRYQLTDSPAPGGVGRGAGKTQSPAVRPPSDASVPEGTGGAGVGGEPPKRPNNASGKTGPTTFAEMGFQGAKAQDKECVVM